MKLFMASPCYALQMNAQTAASLIALTKVLTEKGIPVSFTAQSQPDITDLRNAIATIWYEVLDATHLLFVDADMQFEPDLVLDMLKADKPLIGAIYPKKRVPIEWVGSALTPPKEPEGNLLELEGLGCGIMLIRKDCITQIIASNQVEIDTNPKGIVADLVKPMGATRVLHLFDRVNDDGRRLSEDLSFCKRVRDSGQKVYGILNHVVCHLGLYQYAGAYTHPASQSDARTV